MEFLTKASALAASAALAGGGLFAVPVMAPANGQIISHLDYQLTAAGDVAGAAEELADGTTFTGALTNLLGVFGITDLGSVLGPVGGLLGFDPTNVDAPIQEALSTTSTLDQVFTGLFGTITLDENGDVSEQAGGVLSAMLAATPDSGVSMNDLLGVAGMSFDEVLYSSDVDTPSLLGGIDLDGSPLGDMTLNELGGMLLGDPDAMTESLIDVTGTDGALSFLGPFVGLLIPFLPDGETLDTASLADVVNSLLAGVVDPETEEPLVQTTDSLGTILENFDLAGTTLSDLTGINGSEGVTEFLDSIPFSDTSTLGDETVGDLLDMLAPSLAPVSDDTGVVQFLDQGLDLFGALGSGAGDMAG